MSKREVKPGRVRILGFTPITGPTKVLEEWTFTDQVAFAKDLTAKLQAEVFGRGCGCRTIAELIDVLRQGGVNVEIEGADDKSN